MILIPLWCLCRIQKISLHLSCRPVVATNLPLLKARALTSFHTVLVPLPHTPPSAPSSTAAAAAAIRASAAAALAPHNVGLRSSPVDCVSLLASAHLMPVDPCCNISMVQLQRQRPAAAPAAPSPNQPPSRKPGLDRWKGEFFLWLAQSRRRLST